MARVMIMMKFLHKLSIFLRLPLFVMGLLLFFAAERYLAAESYFKYLKYGALGLIGLSVIFTVLASLAARKQEFEGESRSWLRTLVWQLSLAASLGIYLLYRHLLGSSGAPETFLQKALLAAYLLLAVIGIASSFGFEWAMKENGRGPLAEPRRVSRAGFGYLSIGILLAFLVTVNYTAAIKDKSYDLSYLKTTSPSESTLKMAATLTSPLKIVFFYPTNNEIYLKIKNYFDVLVTKTPNIQMETFDKDLSPTKAEEYRVSENGSVVFDLGGKREKIQVGTTLSSARAILKQFDSEFQKSFLALTASKKTIYFTRGHGEMTWQTSGGDASEKSIKLLQGFLQNQHFTVRPLSITEGSAKDIPDDAAVVAIIGPEKPFMEEEAAALKAYLERGGKLFVMLALEAPDKRPSLEQSPGDNPLIKILEGIGIAFKTVPLANDRNYVSATRSPVDHWFIFSNVFTSHESVTSLSKHEERVAVLAFQSGYLDITPQLGKWKTFETLKSLNDTFADVNKNFVFDKDSEKRAPYTLGTASVSKIDKPADPNKPADPKEASKESKEAQDESRVIVFANAAAASDALIRNPGNLLYIADSIKWLTGDTKLAGALSSEEDVKIRHTQKEDAVWFHGTIIAVPIVLLIIGFGATRRRRGPKTSDKKLSDSSDNFVDKVNDNEA